MHNCMDAPLFWGLPQYMDATPVETSHCGVSTIIIRSD